MNLKDIHIVDIYNENDLKLIKDFDREKYKVFKEIVKTIAKDNYKKNQDSNIIINKYYSQINNNRISAFITVTIAKDTKIANVYPEFIDYKKQFIPNICEYLLLNGMEEVFVFIKSNDQRIAKDLINKNFISLKTDDECDYIPFLIENGIEKEEQKIWK